MSRRCFHVLRVASPETPVEAERRGRHTESEAGRREKTKARGLRVARTPAAIAIPTYEVYLAAHNRERRERGDSHESETCAEQQPARSAL